MLRKTTIFLHDRQMSELKALAEQRGGLKSAHYVRIAIGEFLDREHQKAQIEAPKSVRRRPVAQ